MTYSGYLTDVPGILVGHYTDEENKTGCTAIICKNGAVCGSDVHGFDGSTGRRRPPVIMGHEASGIIVEGGEGVKELAALVCDTVDKQEKAEPSFTYTDDLSLADKIRAVATKIYGAKDVVFAGSTLKQLANFEAEGWAKAPVCIAKTQYSFSDNPKALGAPTGYTLTIRRKTRSSCQRLRRGSRRRSRH